jgi:hypothetical protein
MAMTLGQGFAFNTREAADNRTIYETVDQALNTGGLVNGVEQSKLTAGKRFDGLAVYIQSEQRVYRFVGGTANEHFIPDPAAGSSESGDSMGFKWQVY